MSGRAEKAAVAVRMRAEGKLTREIAAALGVSRSYASSLFNDPTGDGDRKRKRTYGGECIDCGARTDGSNGRQLAPERCQSCRKEYERSQKFWTREAVIDAIQRFAAENGRPPTATEWIYANPEKGYPANSTVRRSSGHESAPFAKWADAIEAAGFPRPAHGFYVRTPEIRVRIAEGQRRRRERERQAA